MLAGRPAARTGRPARGAWIWGVLGLATAAALTAPAAYWVAFSGGPSGPDQYSAHPVSVTQSVSGVTVDSMGADVVISTAHVPHVQVTETFALPPDAVPPGPVAPGPVPRGAVPPGPVPRGPVAPAPPSLVTSVSAGNLTVRDPGCADEESCARFTLVVPPGTAVTVTSEGGSVWLSGTAGAYVDSGGGTVHATGVGGRLTLATGGGDTWITGATGTMHVDTGGGNLTARGIAATSAVVTTGSGTAWLSFTGPVASVTVTTEGGDAVLRVPGGPYAVTASADGGPETLRVPVNPNAPRAIAISTSGGILRLTP